MQSARLNLRPNHDGISDLNTLKAWLAAQKTAGTPVQVCYRLSQPKSVQITPVQIAALDGTNTVFAGVSGMEVTYSKPLAHAYEEIMARLAALEAAAVSNA